MYSRLHRINEEVLRCLMSLLELPLAQLCVSIISGTGFSKEKKNISTLWINAKLKRNLRSLRNSVIAKGKDFFLCCSCYLVSLTTAASMSIAHHHHFDQTNAHTFASFSSLMRHKRWQRCVRACERTREHNWTRATLMMAMPENVCFASSRIPTVSFLIWKFPTE